MSRFFFNLVSHYIVTKLLQDIYIVNTQPLFSQVFDSPFFHGVNPTYHATCVG